MCLDPEIERAVRVFEDFACKRIRQATSETCAGHFRNAVQCPLSAFAVGVIDAAKEIFECASVAIGE